MQSYIYKSNKKAELYLYLLNRDDLSVLQEALLQSLGALEFVMSLELSPERKLAREDVTKVMQSLQNKGFFVQMPPTLVSLLYAENNQQMH